MIIIDGETFKQVADELASVPNGTMKAINHALNDATKGAKKQVADIVREKYAIKLAGVVKDAVSIQSPRNSGMTMEATVIIKGGGMRLRDFKHTPIKPMTGRTRKNVKVTVVNGQGGTLNSRTFKAKMKNGHIGIFQRVEGRYMRGRREAIDELFGPSVPSMAGGNKVRPEIEEFLKKKFDERLAHYIEFLRR